MASFSTQCNSYLSVETDSVYADYDYKKLGYKLFEPAKKHFLNYDLEEISGLSYYKKGVLAAVADEQAHVYFLEATTGKIIREIDFGKPGDFEGVEIMNDQVYAINSSGDIHWFKLNEKNEVDSRSENTVLSRENDCEGLGQLDGKLLIALKGSGDTGKNKVKGKGIYLYDVDKKEIENKELFSIDEEGINDFIKDRKYFNKINDFDPSAIAQHPITGDLYVLSADKVLVILDENFKMKEVVRLPPITYNQAEGICFAPDGTMYISSEGDGGKGKLMEISYNPIDK